MKDYIYSRKAYRIQRAIKELYDYDYSLPNSEELISGYSEGYMPFYLYDEMVANVVEKFGVSSVMAISELTQVSDSGLIGQLIINCERIIDAMNVYADYAELLSDVARYEFSADDSAYEMRLFFKREYHSAEFIFHKILLDTYNIFVGISEFKVSLSDFYLRVGIKNPVVDERFFDTDYGQLIQAGEAYYYARIARKYMDVPIYQPSSELVPGISSVLQKQAEYLRNTTYAGRVESVIFFSEFPSRVGVDYVAETLGVSRNQLQRRLMAEGVKFQEIKNGVLLQRVSFLISAQNRTLKEIAKMLGYSNPSALSRSFKSWSGMSFEQYVASAAYDKKDND